jgi:hypothetical protein
MKYTAIPGDRQGLRSPPDFLSFEERIEVRRRTDAPASTLQETFAPHRFPHKKRKKIIHLTPALSSKERGQAENRK